MTYRPPAELATPETVRVSEIAVPLSDLARWIVVASEAIDSRTRELQPPGVFTSEPEGVETTAQMAELAGRRALLNELTAFVGEFLPRSETPEDERRIE